MPVMTKADVDRMIRDIIGDELAEFRKEIEAVNTKYSHLLTAGPQKQSDGSEKGLRLARYVRALAAGRGDPERAAKIAKERFKDEQLHKALAETDFAGGGAITPDEYAAEFIELLRARTVVRASGAQTVPMNSGSMTIPKQTGAGTANYVGENANIPKSEQTFGQIQLAAKKLAALTPVSNDLIRDASPAADNIVREDLLTVVSLREDLGFIRDDGTQNKPKGLRYWANSNNVFARTQAGGSSTLAEITTDLGKAIRLVEEANVPMTRCGWLFTPRTKWHLMTIRDSNGNLVFAPEMRGGTLMAFPFKTTTQIPNNLGGGSDESEVYFADFSQALIGENTQLIIEVFEGGAYHDGSQVVSGISADQTVVRVIARHDFAVRHDLAVAVITTVDWGA